MPFGGVSCTQTAPKRKNLGGSCLLKYVELFLEFIRILFDSILMFCCFMVLYSTPVWWLKMAFGHHCMSLTYDLDMLDKQCMRENKELASTP